MSRTAPPKGTAPPEDAASPEGKVAGPLPPENWKIDDLARLSGISVDTIRFYQREGLLPDAPRQGRSIVYGPRHLQALERIKDLQANHFSLRAIRALAAQGRLTLVEALFASDSEDHAAPDGTSRGPGVPGTRPTVVRIDPDLASELTRVGLIGEPEVDDRAVLEASQQLLDLGMPQELLVLLVDIYVSKFRELQDEILTKVAGKTSLIPQRELEEFASGDPDNLARVVPLVEVILRHVHNRSLRSVVQNAIETIADDES